MTDERRVEERRAADCEQRDRISRLEMAAENIHNDLERIHGDFEKMSKSYERHIDGNNNTFTEVTRTLASVTAALEAQRMQITDLKDASKNLIETQTRLLNQFSLIDMHNKILEKLQEETDGLKVQIQDLKSMEASAKASWKTLTVVASIIAFLVSTAISIGVFQLGVSSSEAKPTKSSLVQRA